MSTTSVPNIESTYLRLRPDSSVEELDARDFWPRLMRGELGNFHNEYLVTTARYEADWTSWERHPNGDEIVMLLSGGATMILDTPDGPTELALRQSGDYAFVPRNTWHTASVSQAATMLFITAGEGTTNRSR